MGVENFISEALCYPNDYIGYYVSRRLAELHPGQAIIHGETGSFDLEAYVRAGHCSVVQESSIFNHIKTDWRGPKKRLAQEAENAWLNVLWRGHLIDVIFINWTEDRYRSRQYWIVAGTREVADNFFRTVCEWCAEVRGEVLVFDDGDWEKSKELFRAIEAANFDNLILPGSLKQEIQDDFMRFFASREVYEKHRLPWKRGVLLIGPPGNGKTHTVKALINQLKQPCLYVKSLKTSCGPEHGVRRVFARARQTTSCILVMEDIDSLIDGKNRSFFLNELDGFSANTGVVVLATTNHPERLDPAILDRPSRFDRKFYFELPAAAERLAYISAWNKDLQPEMRVSEPVVVEIVEQTEGFSFAYMKELFLSSMMQWMESLLPGGMDDVIALRAARLREQMSSMVEESKKKSTDNTSDEE